MKGKLKIGILVILVLFSAMAFVSAEDQVCITEKVYTVKVKCFATQCNWSSKTSNITAGSAREAREAALESARSSHGTRGHGRTKHGSERLSIM